MGSMYERMGMGSASSVEKGCVSVVEVGSIAFGGKNCPDVFGVRFSFSLLGQVFEVHMLPEMALSYVYSLDSYYFCNRVFYY